MKTILTDAGIAEIIKAARVLCVHPEAQTTLDIARAIEGELIGHIEALREECKRVAHNAIYDAIVEVTECERVKDAVRDALDGIDLGEFAGQPEPDWSIRAREGAAQVRAELAERENEVISRTFVAPARQNGKTSAMADQIMATMDAKGRSRTSHENVMDVLNAVSSIIRLPEPNKLP